MATAFETLWRMASSSSISISKTHCQSCISSLRYTRICRASTLAAPVEETTPPDSALSLQQEPLLPSPQSYSPVYKVKASVLLSRPPQITRDLTPFEKAYFLYQRRFNERLALPFTRYFYYQRGTPGDVGWKRKMKERLTPARDIGKYNAYGEEGWNDELLVGESISEPSEQLRQLCQEAEAETIGRGQAGANVKKEEIERPNPRRTEADKHEDRRSLSRALDRTLYLVVKEDGKESWSLPNSWLAGKESLHTAAERIIIQTGGTNMNTWVVGNVPIGHQIYGYPQSIRDDGKGSEEVGEKNFFMKARILAGQANLKDNVLDLRDYQWLAKDELRKLLHPSIWAAIRNIIAER